MSSFNLFFHASFNVLHFFINSFATWKAHCKDIFPFKRELTKVEQTEILILKKLEMGVKFVWNIFSGPAKYIEQVSVRN